MSKFICADQINWDYFTVDNNWQIIPKVYPTGNKSVLWDEAWSVPTVINVNTPIEENPDRTVQKIETDWSKILIPFDPFYVDWSDQVFAKPTDVFIPSNATTDEFMMIDTATGQLKRYNKWITYSTVSSSQSYTPTWSYVTSTADWLNTTYFNLTLVKQLVTIKWTIRAICYAWLWALFNYEFYDDIVSSVDNGTWVTTNTLSSWILMANPIASSFHTWFGTNSYSVIIPAWGSVTFTNSTIHIGNGTVTSINVNRKYIITAKPL